MKMKLETRLIEEVEHQLEDIHKMTIGSEEYESGMTNISKIINNVVELKKVENDFKRVIQEHEEKILAQDIEIKKLEAEKKDRVRKNVIAVVGIGAPLVVAIWANVYNWPKEETDTMLKSGGRKAMDFLLNIRRP